MLKMQKINNERETLMQREGRLSPQSRANIAEDKAV